MRRYEFTDGPSAKFWEIGLFGTHVSVRYGRMGTIGQKRSWTFASPDEAKRDWEKRIAQKTRKGYQLTLVDQSDGDGSNLGAAFEPETNSELEAEILADPDNDELILVYGDWLAERGDPRGALISTYRNMHAETDPGKFIKLKQHAQEITSKNPNALFGPLINFMDRVVIGWRLGFFDSVRLTRRIDAPRPYQTLDALLAAPATFLLRTLDIFDYDVDVAGRLATASLPVLSTLRITSPGNSTFPIHLPTSLLDGVVAPRLSRLELSELSNSNEALATLSESALADRLTHISIDHVNAWEDEDANINETTAQRLVTHFPALRSFSLVNSRLDDEFVASLESKLESLR